MHPRQRNDQETSSGSAAQTISAFVKSAPICDAVRDRAVQAVLDMLAVTLAGGTKSGLKSLAATLDHDDSPSAFPSFSGPARYEDATLLIGMASHVLDYDDVSMLTVCHPSAPILWALLAATPVQIVSGRILLDSFEIGTEVAIRLGQAMGFRHCELGFHATSPLGSLGAGAACAGLMRLDTRQTEHAIVIAASQASGLSKNFGSMIKSFHVGIAASNGLKAAQLVAAGIEGAPEPLDGEGFLHAFSGGETNKWPKEIALDAPFAIVEPGFEQKRYPCCHMLHKMIEGTLALHRDNWLDLSSVKSIRVDVPAGGTKPLIHPFPKSGLNALFSAPYAIVASLADGRIDKSFTDEAVMRTEIQTRLADVRVIETPDLSGNNDMGRAPVTITLTPLQGENLVRTVIESPGSLRDLLTAVQLGAKWLDCLQCVLPVLKQQQAETLFAGRLRLAECHDVHEWLDTPRKAVLHG